MITAFVLTMMLLIEFLTVQSKGNWHIFLKKNLGIQIIFSALLGSLPGCLGVYTVVSLYVHKMLGFGALVAAMIATFGDEAFVMFAMIPQDALKILLFTFLIAVVAGYASHFLFRKKKVFELEKNYLEYHPDNPDCDCFPMDGIIHQLKNITFPRAILIVVILLFILGLLSGTLGHDHFHIQGHEHHDHEEHNWGWVRISFLALSLFSLFIIITATDHFLEKHLWGHILKKHFLRIFLWTTGALFLVHFLLQHIALTELISSNLWTVLLFALLIGIIPESGPHIVFVTLFASGSIPLSILLANSIVQDGHGALPLLAESRKSFFLMKAVNVIIGFLVGALGLLIGF
jgi:hypothetical protein